MNLKSEKNISYGQIRTSDTVCLARRIWRSSSPLSHPTRWWYELIFLAIIHADRRFFDGIRHILGHRFFELGIVEASDWTWGSMMVSTFIRKWKIPLRYCYFWHTERLKIFCPYFLVSKQHGWHIFLQFVRSSRPICDFFSNDEESF